jgi:hypothetical protein
MADGSLIYSLPSDVPVKWNANQEATILQDSSRVSLLFDAALSATGFNQRVRAVYQQYLWLPEVRQSGFLSKISAHIA